MKRIVDIILMLATMLITIESSIVQAYTQDVGKVTEVYVTSDGTVAFRMSGGFQKAGTQYHCNNNDANFFAGALNPDPVFKSALLTAKAQNLTATVTIYGCLGNDSRNWFSVGDIYIR